MSAEQNNEGRRGENLEIEPRRPMFNVVGIKAHFILKIEVRAPGYLRQACDARLYREYTPVVLLIVGNLLEHMRTRPY